LIIKDSKVILIIIYNTNCDIFFDSWVELGEELETEEEAYSI